MEPTGWLVEYGEPGCDEPGHAYYRDACVDAGCHTTATVASMRGLDLDDLREEAYWCEECDSLLLCSREAYEED